MRLTVYYTANSLLFFLLSLAIIAIFLKGYGALLAYSIDLLVFIASFWMEALSERQRLKMGMENSILSSLQHLKTLLMQSKLPISAALGRVAAASPNPDIQSALIEIRRRVQSGQDLPQAIRAASIQNMSIREGLTQIADAYSDNFDIALAVKDSYNSLFGAYLDKIERFYSSVQRHTSLNMVAGTIVPSFVLFAIAGYSVINTAGSGALVPVLLFVIILPFVFSSLRIAYSDPYAR